MPGQQTLAKQNHLAVTKTQPMPRSQVTQTLCPYVNLKNRLLLHLRLPLQRGQEALGLLLLAHPAAAAKVNAAVVVRELVVQGLLHDLHYVLHHK